MRIVPTGNVPEADIVPPCVASSGAFDVLSEATAATPESGEEWTAWQAAHDEARATCAACPLLIRCLYRSVVESDVAGYAACTFPEQRAEMRRQLAVSVAAPDIDRIAGVRTSGGPIDHDTILAARRAHPGDTFAQLAERLGCSLSTVKRHLRGAGARAAAQAPATPHGSRSTERRRPTVDEVLDVFDDVVGNEPAGGVGCPLSA